MLRKKYKHSAPPVLYLPFGARRTSEKDTDGQGNRKKYLSQYPPVFSHKYFFPLTDEDFSDTPPPKTKGKKIRKIFLNMTETVRYYVLQ